MPSQLIFSFPTDPGYLEESFIVTDSNLDAYQWIKRDADWPNGMLLLVGPKGSGKTHLATIWHEASGAQFIEGRELDEKAVETLSRSRRLVVKNADQCTIETALFHLVNVFMAEGKTLLLTAASPPSGWNCTLPDLRSRLLAMTVASIGAPDDELIKALLSKRFSDRQVAVPLDVIHYLTRHMERSFEAIDTLVEKLDQASLAHGRAITLPLARQILGDL